MHCAAVAGLDRKNDCMMETVQKCNSKRNFPFYEFNLSTFVGQIKIFKIGGA